MLDADKGDKNKGEETRKDMGEVATYYLWGLVVILVIRVEEEVEVVVVELVVVDEEEIIENI